ncbi:MULTISPECIES: signal peptidase I [unclassified Streptomyces]|uniref:signal peptidase I n=1 Tax=unclassified Streptomyces TaxID=2593676 RepID=UPI0006AEDEB8|nr:MULTISPECIES: signal peptidase I [unclassified Streptomyces]
MNDRVYKGNAGKDALDDQGWLLGWFKPSDDVRHSTDVEVKWGVHPRGDQRSIWVTGEERECLLVLVSGKFRVQFHEEDGGDTLLEEPGDYVVWGRGVDHSWTAEEESVVMTVRWPSIPGYKAPDRSTP